MPWYTSIVVRWMGPHASFFLLSFPFWGPGLPPGPTYALVAQQESAPHIRGMLSGASPGQGYDGGETLYRAPYAPDGTGEGTWRPPLSRGETGRL